MIAAVVQLGDLRGVTSCNTLVPHLKLGSGGSRVHHPHCKAAAPQLIGALLDRIKSKHIRLHVPGHKVKKHLPICVHQRIMLSDISGVEARNYA
jgi:hypothetical protein